MPGLRLLLRAAPFIAGALAASIWLHRRQELERPQLPPPREPVDVAIDIVTVVDDLLDIGR